MKHFISKLFLKNNSVKQTVFKNMFWIFSSDMMSRSLKFLLIPVASRLLGPSGFGIFNYTLTLASVFFMISDLGLTNVMQRDYHQVKDKPKLLSSVIYIKIGLLCIVLLCSIVSYFFITDPLVKTIYFVILIKLFLDEIKQLFLNIAAIQSKMEYQAGVMSAESIVTTSLGLYLLLTTKSLFYFSLTYLVGSTVGLVFILFFAKTLNITLIKVSLNDLKKLSKVAFPFLLTTVLGVILVTSDTLMIKWLIGSAAVGYYHVSLKLIGLVGLSFSYVNKVVAPIMNSLHQDHSRLILLTKKGLSLTSLLAIPTVICGMYLSDNLISFLYGPSFIHASRTFQIMLLTLFLGSLLNYINHTLSILRYEVKNMYISSFSIFINICLNLYLIPKWGIEGAAIATLSAKCVDILFSYTYCYRTLRSHLFDLIPLMKYVSISLGILFILPYYFLLFNSILFMIPIGAILYFALLLLFKEKYMLEFIEFLKQLKRS
jgi:O-antigen/teichoic acid export membrane protein